MVCRELLKGGALSIGKLVEERAHSISMGDINISNGIKWGWRKRNREGGIRVLERYLVLKIYLF